MKAMCNETLFTSDGTSPPAGLKSAALSHEPLPLDTSPVRNCHYSELKTRRVILMITER